MYINNKHRFFKSVDKPNILFRFFERFTRVYLERLTTDEYLSYLKRNVDVKINSVLDIGSKYGTLVKSFNDMGIEAYGVEANEYYIHTSVTKNLQWRYFDEDFDYRQVDLITFGMSICYLYNTFEVLKKAKSLLNPEGLIFIVTFNPDCKESISSEQPISKESYQVYCNQLGLKMLSYDTFISNISLDGLNHRNKIISFLKYRLFNKKIFTPKEDGFISFILLKSQ